MKERRRVGLSPPFPPSLSFFLFFNLSLSVHLSFWFLFRSFIVEMGEKEDDCASLKSKSRRKDRTMKKGRREANRAQDNLKLSHGSTHDGVRATLFADKRGTRLRIRFLSRFPADHLTVHFLRAPTLRWRIIYRGIHCYKKMIISL